MSAFELTRFVHIKYISNMATWYYAQLSDATAPHV